MQPPKCHRCLAEDLARIGKTIPMPDRSAIFEASRLLSARGGCVHLAVDGTVPETRGLWAWTACGKSNRHAGKCANPAHVNCETCRAKIERHGLANVRRG